MSARQATVAIVGALALAMPMPAARAESGIAVRSCGPLAGATVIPVHPTPPPSDGAHKCCATACHAAERRKKSGERRDDADPGAL